jgi:hypothetical protein
MGRGAGQIAISCSGRIAVTKKYFDDASTFKIFHYYFSL